MPNVESSRVKSCSVIYNIQYTAITFLPIYPSFIRLRLEEPYPEVSRPRCGYVVARRLAAIKDCVSMFHLSELWGSVAASQFFSVWTTAEMGDTNAINAFVHRHKDGGMLQNRHCCCSVERQEYVLLSKNAEVQDIGDKLIGYEDGVKGRSAESEY